MLLLSLAQNGILLLAKGYPDPEPRDHLDKHEREKDAVLEHVAAPTGGYVRRVMGRRVGEAATGRGRLVEGRGGAEEEGVEDEAHGEDGAEGSFFFQ